MKALKPCPFCGGDAELERAGDRRQSTIYACLHCSCRLETGEEWGYGADWNTRATDARIAELEAELARLRAAGTFNEGIEAAAAVARDAEAQYEGNQRLVTQIGHNIASSIRSLRRPEGGA